MTNIEAIKEFKQGLEKYLENKYETATSEIEKATLDYVLAVLNLHLTLAETGGTTKYIKI